MIPNVFISSTIEDLHYLREGLRDAVNELAYRPVMSDYGEVGYLNPETAAESCYRSVKECQIAVIIIGCRYGNATAEGGISITHREFRTAREEGIPLIALVEKEVLSFKKVFQANKDQNPLTNFPRMDNPALTFALLDEITTSEAFNGLIPFTNVAEAAMLLKKQIADLVGQILTKVFSPMRAEIKDVLAEIKTIRQEFAVHQKQDPRFLQIIRYIIDENRSKGFKYLIEHTIGPIDKAVPLILEADSFDDFVKKSGWTLVIRDSGTNLLTPNMADNIFGAMSFGVPSRNNPMGTERAEFLINKN
ncbi:MAG TPA: DUF4062 domain-containing protein, partial [Verrucomicrobiae bacterium]